MSLIYTSMQTTPSNTEHMTSNLRSPVFTIKEALSYGWKKLSENFWFLVLLSLTFFVINALLSKVGGGKPMIALAEILNFILSFFAMFTFVRMGLKIQKGERPFWNSIFEFKGILFAYYIVGAILFTLANIIGLFFLIVPGIIIAIRFGLFAFIIIDEHMVPSLAFRKSWDMTRGYFWHLLGLAFVLFLINFAGALAFVVGLFITAPFCLLATVYVYEKLKNNYVPNSHAKNHTQEHSHKHVNESEKVN